MAQWMMPSMMGSPLGPNTQAQKMRKPNCPTQYSKLPIDNGSQISGDLRPIIWSVWFQPNRTTYPINQIEIV